MSTVLGVGIDVVELERLQKSLDRHGSRFVRRICLAEEIDPSVATPRLESLGGLFAAKEAVLKALGTGWGGGLGFLQVEVRKSDAGQPMVVLHQKAASRARDLGIDSIHLSITHEHRYAAAVAVAQGTPAKETPISA